MKSAKLQAEAEVERQTARAEQQRLRAQRLSEQLDAAAAKEKQAAEIRRSQEELGAPPPSCNNGALTACQTTNTCIHNISLIFLHIT